LGPVLALAQQLRQDGIEAELDQFNQTESLHWPTWCEEQLRPENSDFVICIFTAEYKRRIENRVPADAGKKVFWEGRLIYNYLYNGKGNDRFLPVLLDKSGQDIPLFLDGYTRFELDVLGLENSQSEYVKLYRLLTRQPARLMTEIGALQKLPPLPEEARRTDFILLTQDAIPSIKSNTEEILAILKDRAAPISTAQRPHNLPPWTSSDYFIGRSEEL
jgi:TIR domain